MRYTIDRSPEAVVHYGHPEIIAWSETRAAKGYVAQAPAHRSIITKADAVRLVRLYYGKPLEMALSEGLI